MQMTLTINGQDHSVEAPAATLLGEVLREVRSTWRSQGHLTYLAYVLYGDPQARVHYTG